ncbi:SRPBCC family protein [Sphingopyxis sp. MWB1]|uniref:SRPBCC family protein n=1 Tax=Sphingopyxis sp. MWB1 TaxID=1537715 RepID=UPI000519F169|nr:SRPBCC family protein [Sphingopyxis sp. MWB1]
MNDVIAADDFGVLTEAATLTISRLLPGSAQHIWSYLVDSDRRRQWLAAGAMEEKAGASVDFVWRNDELMDDPGPRPDSVGEENRMTCEILVIEPPHRLQISWGSTGGVTFTLEERGADTLLTITHHRVMERGTLLAVSAGWHTHLDVLVAKLGGETPRPFWPEWQRLRALYDARFAAAG